MIKQATLLALALPFVAFADFTKTNPVTGETESYTWKFVGTDVWNNTSNWQDSNGDNPSGVPAKSGDNVWDPILFDGNTININASMSVEGWNLRMGLYNGANVTMNTFVKYQGETTMWMTVDETSQLTVGGFGGGNIADNKVIKLSVAKANGIAWNVNLSSSGNANNTFEYYLMGEGSVSYQAVSAANHKIKQADVTLSEVTEVKFVNSKTLVSFTASSTVTFTADAVIKVKRDDGSDLKDINLSSVTATTPTLTAANEIGDCELVQTSTGILLYYVDYQQVYKPSISVNFTSGTSLSTSADVGIGEYAVPGTSWNNLIGNNGSLATVTGIDATGAASAISGAKVTISGTRGYWHNNGVSAASDLRQGYIDDNADNASPQFVVEGIPYDRYRTILYFASDNDNTKFGYVTVNGLNYKGDLDNTTTVTSTGGSEIWGSASLTAYTEGGNYLVIPKQSRGDGTLTVVSHRLTGSRAGLAAVQIVEAEPDAGENDLIIEVSGGMTYTVSEAKTLSGTVYVIGNGTLTLDGSAKISAATIDLAKDVTLNVNTDRLDATTFTGTGTVVYDGIVPPTGKGWTDSAWTGTVWLKNKSDITGNDNASTGVKPNSLGNANSKVKFSGVSGWIEAPVTYIPEIVLENDSNDYALLLTNGNSPSSTNSNDNRCTKIKKLSGSGTLGCGGSTYAWPLLQVWDATGFTGSIDTSNASGNGAGKTGLVVVFCAENTVFSDTLYNLFKGEGTYPHPHTICVASGTTATQPSTATWTAETSFIIDGTLNANGTLASSASSAVTGSGTVVFTGRAPTPTGDAWWKNAAWTGTVQVKDVTNMVGTGSGTILAFNDYGNDGSTFELAGCTGWLPGPYECTVPLKITGTLNLNNGLSDRDHAFTINHLKGNGTIYGGSTADKVIIRVKEWSEFTGLIQLDKKIVVFGEDEMPVKADLTAGQIIVSAGAVVTAANSTTNGWWATGGIKVNGELRAPNLDKFGGGTTITTTDNGVFTFITNSNADDMNVDYARLQGTGTLRLEGTAYRCISTNNFPTAMTVDNRLTAGFLHRIPGLEITIGSLAGDGYLRSDWGGSAGDRDLKVLQAKDTTWSGKFWVGNGHRFRSLIVAPGATTAGTLTLSATHESTESTGLTVESGAAVNLTGTWVGNTTVAGTFGGTGTLTGDLTFSGGATFKAGASPLTVSGNVSASGVVNVDISDIVEGLDEERLIISTTNNIDVSNFDLSYASYMLESTDEGLVVKPAGGEYDGVEFGVINVPGTVIHPKVTVDGRNGDYVGQYEGDECSYSLYNIPLPTNATSSVFITYEPDAGYVIVSNTVVEVENVGDVYWFGADKDSGEEPDPVVKSVDELSEVAFITDATGFNTLYATLDAAVAAVKAGETITVIHDASLADLAEGGFHLRKTTVTIDGYDCSMGGNLKIADGVDLMFGSGVTVTDDIIAMLYATDATITYPTNTVLKVQAPEGYQNAITNNLDGTATITFEEVKPGPGPVYPAIENIIGIRIVDDDVIITTTPTNAVGTLRVSTDVAGKDVVERIGVTAESYETKYPKGSYPSLFFRIESESE